MASRPLVRKRETNSAVCRQATMLMKSALGVAQLRVGHQPALQKDLVEQVGSPPYSSLQMIMERMMPSVIFSTRSSSAGSSGAAVKVIRT